MLRPQAAADYLGISRSWLEKARLIGKPPRFVKIGKLVLYDPDDLDEWLEANKRTSTSEPVEVA